MASMIEPAADHIWASAGTIITAEETIEIQPETDEDWILGFGTRRSQSQKPAIC